MPSDKRPGEDIIEDDLACDRWFESFLNEMARNQRRPVSQNMMRHVPEYKG